jgi:hypothetical protein
MSGLVNCGQKIVSDGVPMLDRTSALFIMRLTIIIGVRTNKECPNGFVRLITVGRIRHNIEVV